MNINALPASPRAVFPGTLVLCSQINNGHPARVFYRSAREYFDPDGCISCSTYEHCKPTPVESSLAWELCMGLFWPFRLVSSLKEVYSK